MGWCGIYFCIFIDFLYVYFVCWFKFESQVICVVVEMIVCLQVYQLMVEKIFVSWLDFCKIYLVLFVIFY